MPHCWKSHVTAQIFYFAKTVMGDVQTRKMHRFHILYISRSNTTLLCVLSLFCYTVKTCVKWTLSKRLKIGFQAKLSHNAGQKCILQYFRPPLSYHLTLNLCFVYFFSGRFTHAFKSPPPLPHPVALAAVRSKAVVLFLLIRC